MAKCGSMQHEEELHKLMDKLKQNGFHVIELKGFSPDAIAVKDGIVSAVELIGSTYSPKNKKWEKDDTIMEKKRNYSMFDDVIIHVFHRNHGGDSKRVGFIADGTNNSEGDVNDF